MTLKQQLTTFLPAGKKRKKVLIISLLSVCILLCGFSWTWAMEFTSSVIFPIEEAVETGMILNFDSVVNMDDLQLYLTEPLIAEQMVDGIQSNLSAHIYDSIELPDMTAESVGRKIIRTIFDRMLS